MKLPFGIYQGKYIHISEVNSGKTTVLCPYCQQQLMAKKGRIKRHHFAHDGKGCTQHFAAHFFDITGRLKTQLPLSIYANQKLSKIQHYYKELKEQEQNYSTKTKQESELIPALKAQLQVLKKMDATGDISEIMQQVDRFIAQKIAPFPAFHWIKLPQFTAGYTDGKRECDFEELNPDTHEYFYPKAFQKYVTFLKNYHQKVDTFKENTAKIVLFEKDLAYFKQFDLYFLEVIADHQKMYKIGLTSRDLTLRRKEIKQALSNHFLKVQLKPLFHLKGFAFLETFFKQKYATHQVKIGQLTEYFSFSDAMLSLILKDLNLLNYTDKPERNQAAWIDWLFFNFSGKIYGYREKSVYVNNTKFVLEHEEVEKLEALILLRNELKLK